MFKAFVRATAFALGISTLAAPVSAATMTFNSIPDPFANTYSEDGVLASGNGHLGVYNGRGGVHFDDGGTTAPSAMTFSMASNFNAISFLLDPVNFNFAVLFDDRSYLQPTYLNVLVQGFRGGALVSSLKFGMGAAPDPYTVSLGSAFTNLNSLVIGILAPNFAEFSAMPGFARFAPCSPCSHFNIDDLKLAPVPLPAGLPLLALGLGGLGFIGRRKKKAA